MKKAGDVLASTYIVHEEISIGYGKSNMPCCQCVFGECAADRQVVSDTSEFRGAGIEGKWNVLPRCMKQGCVGSWCVAKCFGQCVAGESEYLEF